MVWFKPNKTKEAASRAVDAFQGRVGEYFTGSNKKRFEKKVDEIIDKKAEGLFDAMASKQFSAVDKALEKETKKALQDGFFKRNFKRLGIGAAVVGGVVGLGLIASNMRKNRSHVTAEHDAELDALAAASMPMQVPQPMEAAGPADGRGEYEWRNKVGGRSPQIAGPNQPAMTAVSADSVQNLGAPPSRA